MKLLAMMALAAQLAAAPTVEQSLKETRKECIDQIEILDPLKVEDVMTWYYLIGRIDQIDDTLQIMGYYDVE